MLRALIRQPALALMTGVLGLAMFAPSALAAFERDWVSGRAFLYSGLTLLGAATFLAFGMGRRRRDLGARGELTTLLLLWVLLPAAASLPLIRLTPSLGLSGAYFEMVAALTTTGGSAYADPARVPDALHLWRGLVAWVGGFLTLMAAFVVLVPRRLGGLEVEASALTEARSDASTIALGAAVPPLSERMLRALGTILPAYVGLTAALALVFSGLGQGPLSAAMHAMAILSTSGISPHATGLAQADSLLTEAVAALFLIAAATRLIYSEASQSGARRSWARDRELGLMAALVMLATLGLFLRHWIGAITFDLENPVYDGFAALWGTVFTTLSYITTTGFESTAWISARDWSGLENPGLFLLGLCAIGGGAATTAGGMKLVRADALIRHGGREITRLAQPVGAQGQADGMGGLMRQGAVIAWAFLMLYIFGILLTVLGLTAARMPFDEALVAAIAALSNTGPAYAMVTEAESFAALNGAERLVLCAAMILGRIEALALIALFNPDAWRQRRKSGGWD